MATTWRSSARATISSSGIRATATTRSRARAGTDKLLFNGANVNENINIVANGGRALFLRDIANVTMDMDDVEVIEFNALGGADNIVVGDLTGTDVTQVKVNLASTLGGTVGDNAADTVTVNGTNGADVIKIVVDRDDRDRLRPGGDDHRHGARRHRPDRRERAGR